MGVLKNIPEDCEFPQLREIADTEKLTQTLQRYMGPSFTSGEMQVESCRIEQLHYKPGGDCKISLKARISRANQQIEYQIYHGRLFSVRWRSTQEIYKRKRAGHQNLSQPKFGPPLIYIPEWKLLLWAYPNDPNLPGLPLMVNPEKVLALVKAAPGKFGLSAADPLPVAIEAEMTKYTPGRRCGYIYRMTLASSNSHGVNSSCAVYGKAYREGEGKRAYAIMKQIWESEACQRGDLVLPQPYSYDPENKILWQEALSGQSFAKIAGTIKNLPEVTKEIGRRLSAFHGTHLDLPQEMTFNFQVEEVQKSVAAINETFPDYAERCNAVSQKLLAAAAQLGPGPMTPVHASFKFSHILATEKGIAFIDFDSANLGDPGYDLGRFIAHLYKMKANWEIDSEVAEQTITNFCESYNQAASSPVPQERIGWFAASHLVSSQVYKSVKRIDTGLVNKLLKIADRLCPA